MGDEINIGFGSSQKKPARAHVKFVRIGFKDSRSVMLRVNADGVEENVFAHAITQHVLYLEETRGFQWT